MPASKELTFKIQLPVHFAQLLSLTVLAVRTEQYVKPVSPDST
jgi:hypothetical protein